MWELTGMFLSSIGQICGANSLLAAKFGGILRMVNSMVLKLFFRIVKQRRSHPKAQCMNLDALTSQGRQVRAVPPGLGPPRGCSEELCGSPGVVL